MCAIVCICVSACVLTNLSLHMCVVYTCVCYLIFVTCELANVSLLVYQLILHYVCCMCVCVCVN